MLVVSKGAYREGVLGSVNYGRDSDSIATMTGAISGAMNGVSGIPQEWLTTVETASRRNFKESAALMSSIAREIREKDLARVGQVKGFKTKSSSMPEIDLKDRARGCLAGLAVGDALGRPVEECRLWRLERNMAQSLIS